MGMSDILGWSKTASLYLQSNLFVCIAERCAFQHSAVYFLYTEHRVVTGIVKYMLINLHTLYYICCHIKAVFQFAEGREKQFLDNLQVAEIPARQIIHNKHNLCG